MDFEKVPVNKSFNKVYENYKNGESPRKERTDRKFDFKDFPDVHQQIHQLLKFDYEFVTEIPNPDMHRNYVAVPKYGRKRK